jgi:hypothetical protein
MLQLPKLRREYASPHADTIARKLCDRYGKLVTNCEFSIAVKSEADRERLADRFVGGAGVVGMGCLADRLGELGRALAGFSEEIGSAGWRDTVVVVISEFGRTFRENGDHGTDHGHGSVYWVMGGGINGGRILGDQVKVEQASLFQNRDYPVLTDYRSMFAGLFQRMYGLEAASVQRIFAGVHPAELGLVQSWPC